MKNFINKFINDESGQDLVEYALLLTLLTLAAVATLGTLATTVSGVFTTANTKVS